MPTLGAGEDWQQYGRRGSLSSNSFDSSLNTSLIIKTIVLSERGTKTDYNTLKSLALPAVYDPHKSKVRSVERNSVTPAHRKN